MKSHVLGHLKSYPFLGFNKAKIFFDEVCKEVYVIISPVLGCQYNSQQTACRCFIGIIRHWCCAKHLDKFLQFILFGNEHNYQGW